MIFNLGANILIWTRRIKKKAPIAKSDGGLKRTTKFKEPNTRKKK